MSGWRKRANHVRAEHLSLPLPTVSVILSPSQGVCLCIKSSQCFHFSLSSRLHWRVDAGLNTGEGYKRPKGIPVSSFCDLPAFFCYFPLSSLPLSSLPHFPQRVVGLPPFLLVPLLIKRLHSAWTVAASMQNGLWQFLSHQHLRRGWVFQESLCACVLIA